MDGNKKTIFIALDGAEKSLLIDWGRRGILPNVGALLERSTWCTVHNPPLMYAGSIWPSFYTGVSPARHGKYCSWQIKPGSYDFQRVPRYDPRFPALWEVMSDQGKKVAIIDAPKSWLSDKTNGVQIIDWAAEDFEVPLETHPADLAAAIRRDYGHNEINEIEGARQGYPGIERMRHQLLERLRTKKRMTDDLLARDDWDFFFSLFTEVHTAGHVAWHLHDPDHPLYDRAQAERIGDVMREIYIATDAVLGDYMKLADHRTNVIIHSINGMGGDYTGNHLIDDMLLAIDRSTLGPARRALTSAADHVDRLIPGRIYDAVYPIQRGARRTLGLPVRDRRYRSAFRVPTNQVAAGIRLNLEGREPNGLVPVDQYDEACARITRELRSFVNKANGRPAVKSVMRTRDVYRGEHLEDMPDLLVEWPQEGPLTELESPTAGRVFRQYGGHRTGDHRPDGLLFAIGAGQGRGEIDAIATIDMAATLTSAVGANFDGTDGADRALALGLTGLHPS